MDMQKNDMLTSYIFTAILVVIIIGVGVYALATDERDEEAVDVGTDEAVEETNDVVEVAASEKDFYSTDYRFAFDYPDGWYEYPQFYSMKICEEKVIELGFEDFCFYVSIEPKTSESSLDREESDYEHHDITILESGTEQLGGSVYDFVLENFQGKDLVSGDGQYQRYRLGATMGDFYVKIDASDELIDQEHIDIINNVASSLILNPDYEILSECYCNGEVVAFFTYPNSRWVEGENAEIDDDENAIFIHSGDGDFYKDWQISREDALEGGFYQLHSIGEYENAYDDVSSVENITVDGFPATIGSWTYQVTNDDEEFRLITDQLVIVYTDEYDYVITGEDDFDMTFQEFLDSIVFP